MRRSDSDEMRRHRIEATDAVRSIRRTKRLAKRLMSTNRGTCFRDVVRALCNPQLETLPHPDLFLIAELSQDLLELIKSVPTEAQVESDCLSLLDTISTALADAGIEPDSPLTTRSCIPRYIDFLTYFMGSDSRRDYLASEEPIYQEMLGKFSRTWVNVRFSLKIGMVGLEAFLIWIRKHLVAIVSEWLTARARNISDHGQQ